MDPKFGGPSQGIRNITPALLDLGVETEVLSFDPPTSKYLGKDSFKIYPIGPRKGPYQYCSKLSSWLENNIFNYDILIIHGLWLHNSFGTYRVWNRMKYLNRDCPKLFVMPHGMLDPYFQKAEGRQFKALRNKLFYKLIERKVVNGVDGILFTCEQELLLARKAFKPYRPNAELNVGYGIEEPPVFKPEFREAFLKKCPDVKNKSFLLFLSRIHPKKGVNLLINAISELKANNQDLPALVIAGPGLETDYGKAIIKLANESGCEIYFPGMLQGSEKWGALYGCDAFILPSHQENFGIAVVEALACKKPVLITNKVNIWREIEKDQSGFVFADELSGVISGIKNFNLLSPLTLEDMQSQALQTFHSRYTNKEAAEVLKRTLMSNRIPSQ